MMEWIGACLCRILDWVERSLRRRRCGIMTGSPGKDIGIFVLEKKRWVESSPEREKYCGMVEVWAEGEGGGELRGRGQVKAVVKC